jgi:hypothetical protein
MKSSRGVSIKQKKAVSPIIVTVTLVLIVVVAVTIITLWGRGIQKDIQTKEGGIAAASLSCTGLNLDVTSPYGGSVEISNNGPDISGVILVVKGDGEVASNLYKQSIENGNSRSFPYSGIPGVGNVEEVTVIPAMGEGIFRPCTEQKIELEF